LHGVEPSGDTYRGRFAILLEPAPVDSIVSACVAGVCVAKVDVDQGMESAEFADTGAGHQALKAQPHGSAKILCGASRAPA